MISGDTVENILKSYVEQVNYKLPGVLSSLYIYGSYVLGDFDKRYSDIDFIAVVSNELWRSDIKKLELIHKKIQRKFPKPNMNGIYVQWSDLGKSPAGIKPFPYFFERKMYRLGHFEINPVTWYGLKYFGRKLLGKDISELPYDINWDAVRKYDSENINSYWKNWIVKAGKNFCAHSLQLLLSRRKVEWGVLSVSRLYYSLKEGSITSKVKAGEYMLKHAPGKFNKIINEALSLRYEKKSSLYSSYFKRKKDVLDYMNYVRDEINKISSRPGSLL